MMCYIEAKPQNYPQIYAKYPTLTYGGFILDLITSGFSIYAYIIILIMFDNV